jgi:hypothetical protein
MNRATLLGAAALMTLPAAAFAQTTPVSTTAAPANGQQQNGPGIRSNLKENLELAGFTGVTVMPDAFLVQATDQSGNPVTMFLNPGSVTLVSDIKTATPATSAPATGMFTTIPAKDDLSSMVVGLNVYNGAHQNLGTIKDVAFDSNGVQAYIVGVGGFLGMGDHYVAVRPASVALTFNEGDKTWHATLNATADTLKAAPEYKYSHAS